MNRALTTILAAAATALSGTAGASCILADGGTADRGACRSVYGETRQDDGIGNHQSLGYFNSIYRWSDDEVSWATWSYEATALRNSGGASLSARTSLDLLDHSEPSASVSTKFGTATYRGHATGVYALATPFGGNVGAVRSALELTADFTGGELTGKFDRFSVLLEASSGDGWQRIPASITVAGRVLEDGFVHTDTGFSLKDGVVGSGQLDWDFITPVNSATWRVERNRVLGLTPDLPDLPEFSFKAHFVKDATETIGTLETISPLAIEGGGVFSLSMSFGGDTATMPAPDLSTFTLAEAMLDPANTIEALSLSLHLDSATNTASETDKFLIESVASDGEGGFHVIYDFYGVKENVHFTSADFRAQDRRYRKQIGDRNYELWSEASRFDGITPGASKEFDYFNVINSSNWGGHRSLAAYGIATGSAGMPTGTATYHGRMDADAFDNTLDSLRTSVARSFIFGDVILTADFTEATLSGRIFRLRIRRPDASNETLPSTTGFQITDGAIAGDIFTATLTGVDDDADAPLEDSMRGFTGDVSGQFYGPGAREFAGTLGASRTIGDDDDWTMAGWLGGTKERDIAIDSSEQLSAFIHRDWTAETTSPSSASATVQPITGGYRITFTTQDGTQETVDMAEADLGGFGGPSTSYEKAIESGSESRAAILWRLRGWFPRRPEFDYVDVNGIAWTHFTPGEERNADSVVDSNYGFVVRGTRTATNDLPSGTAEYSGPMAAKSWDTTGVANRRTSPEYRGNFSMTADFGSGSVMATVANVTRRPGNSGSFASTSGTGLTFEATVSGNAFTANALTGTGHFAGYTGSAKGAFYGPQAAEAAGVFSGEDTASNKALHGWFVGDKQ